MSTRCIEPRGSVGARRGEPVICVEVGDRLEDFIEALRRVLAHSPPDTRVLVYDPAGALSLQDDRTCGSDRFVYLLPGDRPADLAAAAAAAAPGDIVTVGPGCLVAAGWLDRLREAAANEAGIATASALGAASVVAAGTVTSPRWLDAAASTVAAAAVRTRPRLVGPEGGCVYVRRAALELAGDGDMPDLGRFGARCVHRGLFHVLADDVLVLDGAAPPGGANAKTDAAQTVQRALGVARRALGGLSVLIDARALDGPLDGTRVHVAELIGAVARSGEARVTALVSRGLDAETRRALEGLPDVTLRTAGPGEPDAAAAPADVVHRPHQISAPADLAVLGRLGDRLVVTHQDLISFHDPGYFPSAPAWEGYRDLTRRALAAADRVLFFSEHVRADALSEELVEPERAVVAYLGVDHSVGAAPAAPVPPPGAEALAGGVELMVCLGNDFAHKNRLFALEVLAELQLRHDWQGRLVLAGPHVRYGSSRADEQRRLDASPRLARAVISLGELSDAAKGWLLHRARLVLYPTVHEGFGLIPFEAAAAGVPCLWATGTALAELLPESAAEIVPWDAEATAENALRLMRDEAARAANVAAVTTAAGALRWEDTGRRLIEVYRSACDGPPAPAASLERGSGLMHGGLSEDAMRLVGPDGLLSQDLERPLLALLARPRLAGALRAFLKSGYRASRRGRDQHRR